MQDSVNTTALPVDNDIAPQDGACAFVTPLKMELSENLRQIGNILRDKHYKHREAGQLYKRAIELLESDADLESNTKKNRIYLISPSKQQE